MITANKKMSKRLLTLLISVSLIAGLFASMAGALPVLAAGGDGIFADGIGTAQDPYIIETAAQLNSVRNYLDKHFKLANDIDLSDYLAEGGAGYNGGAGWEPIGTLSKPFAGNFDGKNYLIISLTAHRPEQDDVGLFGYMKDGTIKNVGLRSGKIFEKINVGGLVARNDGGTIANCYNSNTVIAKGSYAGGVVSLNYNSDIVTYC